MLHQATINRRQGFVLAMITSFMWAVLPIALKTVLTELDPYTTTWYRFSLAGIMQTSMMLYLRKFPVRFYGTRTKLLWAGAILGLVANHTFFVAGLKYLQPVATTIFIQLAPVFLLAGGLIIFKEPFSKLQWSGLGILLSGMVIFFWPEIRTLNALSTEFFIGVAMIVLAAITWTIYALCQKQLLVKYTSRQVMTLVYLGGTLLLLPMSVPVNAFSLDAVRLGVLLFAGLNTFIAYGTFSEALNHWDASRVSAVLAIIPVMALFMMMGAQEMFPGFVERELLTPIKMVGAFVVVAGSMTCALAKRRLPRAGDRR